MTYGWWIDPAGEVIEVEHLCGHSELVDYRDAMHEGWIAVVDQDPPDLIDHFGAKFSEVSVTARALKKLLYMVVKSKKRAFELHDMLERYRHLPADKTKKLDAVLALDTMIKKKTVTGKKALKSV